MIRLIIPAWNEARALESLLPNLPDLISDHPVEALVVSDGSTDDTVAVARAHRTDVLALDRNGGKGAAVAAALELLTDRDGDQIVVLMDADGQHDPRDLPNLVAPLLNGSADLSVGSRYALDERRGSTPVNRYAVRRTTVAVLQRVLHARFTDPYCGYRAFTRAALDRIQLNGNRYEGELEVLFEACRLGLTVAEVPVRKIYGPDTSKMIANGSPLLGRLSVIQQYTATIIRGTRSLKATDPTPERSLVR